MRRLLTALGLGAGLASSAGADTSDHYGKYESPRYTVEATHGDAELRRYDPYILAEVTVRGDRYGALSRGFQVLAGYIFGGNAGAASVDMTSPVTQAPEKIAMTSPVGQSGEGDLWTVTFSMPSEYTLDTLPEPNSDAVRFVEVPVRRMLVLTFSGRATDRVLDARTEELRTIADQAGIAVQDPPVFMYYDDPFTLPWRRRNEVALELADG